MGARLFEALGSICHGITNVRFRPIADAASLVGVVLSVDYFSFNILEPVPNFADRYGADDAGFCANQGNVFSLGRQFVHALES